MPTDDLTLRLIFNGGWATDFGTTVDATPDETGRVVIPFLTEAEDCFFEMDGGPHKMGGTSRANASVITSATVVGGVFDYWKQGTAGSPSRRHVVHADTRIIADADDHVYTNVLATGLTSNATPSYTTFDDKLIIASDSTVDVPKVWDQITFGNLGGTPPRFSFSASHKNRVFAAGDFANPSRLYYSANLNPQDWVGAGSGTIDIDPGDGDQITGIVSYKNELWVFKGPNKGSIHRITGSSPTDFARVTFIKGIGACWHNAITFFGDDLLYVSQYGTVHSLKATASFGDFNEASLSRPINTWLGEHLNYNRLRKIWCVNDPLNSQVYISISIDSSATNNVVLLMDYKGYPASGVKWSLLRSYNVASLGVFVDTNNIKRVFAGSNDGFVLRTNVSTRSINALTALTYKVTTPFMSFGHPAILKNIQAIGVGIDPKGSYNSQICWQNDEKTKQCLNFFQSSTAALDSFILGTSSLGGASYIERFLMLEEGGEFRSIQFQLNDAVINQDLEVHTLSCLVRGNGIGLED